MPYLCTFLHLVCQNLEHKDNAGGDKGGGFGETHDGGTKLVARLLHLMS